MRLFHQKTTRLLAALLSMLALHAVAQTENKTTETTAPAEVSKKVPANTNVVKESNATQPAKKMVQDATINLQTTITGNQEQPRVLYILPWQSPQTADVDFEPLESQQKAVFNHVEREELRRELESSGELKSSDELK